MKIYRIPDDLRTIIFDIDGTLYTSPEYVEEQVDVQIRHLAHIRGVPEDQLRNEIKERRRQWALSHGGKSISLGNTLTQFGIPIETSIEWRNTLLRPQDYLSKDENLREALIRLGADYNLICVTNNPVDAARKTLEAVGIADILPNIIGLDTCKKSKPCEEVLVAAAKATGCTFEQCLSIGDRYDIDVALPLKLGMGGIVVSGAEDIYHLDSVLAAHTPDIA